MSQGSGTSEQKEIVEGAEEERDPGSGGPRRLVHGAF